MTFVFDYRSSDSPSVEMVWRTQSDGAGGSFISVAEPHWEMVVTRQAGQVTFSVRGPETKATPAPIPENAEFLGLIFRLGTFMPGLPFRELIDGGIHLPMAGKETFWLLGSTWGFPSFDNADTFIARLMRQGVLAYDPIVEDVLHGQIADLSPRSVQRRFLRATGLTQGVISQIQRARRAMTLLQQGISISDTIEQAGYADQPHLTRSLRRFVGQTPGQVIAAVHSH